MFEYRENPREIILSRVREFLYKKITVNSSTLFLKGGDIISIRPQIDGLHEPILTKLIETFSKSGYGDFLVDIGANIGLISCQTGKFFKEVHMFEPNPILCKILEANTAITLSKKLAVIYPIGLGESDRTVKLTVPKKNWGGAFIKDSINSYELSLLSSKDGFAKLDEENYFEVDIVIKNTAEFLKELFNRMRTKGLKHGVIKIDVEGYETVVLNGIASALPEDMRAYIIFESWSNKLNIEKILQAFEGRALAYKVIRRTP
ncbi:MULTISPECIES: FkbM family methyltransferase [unclassified Polynucleobacter]|uniref:FkbM family methyltransferase n=1 Tax=unclassified Polynucleobacter TaxID=2640945 RepID=UPI00257225F7|nr:MULTISPECIES: FkbM family methyltransferase [unclassified Polynucleobacter]BEI42148.1 hypothetical protein PHIN10_02970 [Polynucleobacter sp. HIN10]BEI43926.1 hypothetical protein PHIN11_02980 [Polynucleobacter sp. HIN11]